MNDQMEDLIRQERKWELYMIEQDIELEKLRVRMVEQYGEEGVRKVEEKILAEGDGFLSEAARTAWEKR